MFGLPLGVLLLFCYVVVFAFGFDMLVFVLLLCVRLFS